MLSRHYYGPVSKIYNYYKLYLNNCAFSVANFGLEELLGGGGNFLKVAYN